MTSDTPYEQWAEAKLREINAKMEQYKAKAMQADADARIEADEAIARFKRQQEDLKAQVAKMTAAGQDAFEELKGGTRKAIDEMSASVDRAIASFRR